MPLSSFEIKKQICEAGRKLYSGGFVAASHGNISVKVNDNEYYCTPTGVSKGDLTPDMIIRVDGKGNKLEGKLNPTSEIKLHLRLYQERPDVTAIVHAYPPVATALTVAGIAMDQSNLSEAILSIGNVPTCEYGKDAPTTNGIPNSLIPYIQKQNAFLLEYFGALTFGCDLQKAIFTMEEVEFNAVICKHARELGIVEEIPCEQLEKLMDRRKKSQIPGRHPGCKKCKNLGTENCRCKHNGDDHKCACGDQSSPTVNADAVAEITKRVIAKFYK